MCFRTIHINLFKHLEFDAVTVDKFSDFSRAFRLLSPELIAREGEDLEPISFILVLVVQSYQLSVVRLGCPSGTRNVHYNENFVPVFFKIDFFSFQALGSEFINGSSFCRILCGHDGHLSTSRTTGQTKAGQAAKGPH
eukprot:TRINITY_DN8412_c0_g1_i1.p1 TRINITY_DN8412_c0_g1~~TRINITY_DN8412_c0_g1_i1.p1  ORF type:complete len:138 (+),score=5.33 TRINITY_DN8412_c0_g1_i1:328-741(+)